MLLDSELGGGPGAGAGGERDFFRRSFSLSLDRLRRRSREWLRRFGGGGGGGVGVLLRRLSRLRERRLDFSTDFDLLRDFLRFSRERLLFFEVDGLRRVLLLRDPLRRRRSRERDLRRRSRDLQGEEKSAVSIDLSTPSTPSVTTERLQKY